MNEELDPKSMWSLSYGIFVVASCFEGKANGQIANTVFQVSADPPRVAVAINKENYTHEFISKSRVFTVSVLDESTPMNFIGRFGFRTGRDIDKLENVIWKDGMTGCPVITENAVSVFEGRVFGEVDVGTHTLFVADVVGGSVLSSAKPLTYAAYHEMKGEAPKSAPTYRGTEPRSAPTYRGPKEDKPEGETPQTKQKKEKGGSGMKKYECNVCGYVYDPDEGDSESGVEPGTAFEALPEDWVCPVCGAGKEEFTALD